MRYVAPLRSDICSSEVTFTMRAACDPVFVQNGIQVANLSLAVARITYLKVVRLTAS